LRHAGQSGMMDIQRRTSSLHAFLILVVAVAASGVVGGISRPSLRLSLWDVDRDGNGLATLPEMDAYSREHGVPLIPAHVFDGQLRDRLIPPRVRALLLSSTPPGRSAQNKQNKNKSVLASLAISPHDARIPIASPHSSATAGTSSGSSGGGGSSSSGSSNGQFGRHDRVLNARIYDAFGPLLLFSAPSAFPPRFPHADEEEGQRHSGGGGDGRGDGSGSNATFASTASLSDDDTAAGLALFGHAVLSIDGHSCEGASAAEVAQRLRLVRSAAGVGPVLVLLLDVMRLPAFVHHPPALRRQVLANFKALDSNRDFAVSPAEWAAATASSFAVSE
jgi:hypothetical protein